MSFSNKTRKAFKHTTPLLYKSLITKPGESNTLLFGDSMENQVRSLEMKEKLQKAIEPEADSQEDLDASLPKEASAIWKGSTQGSEKLEMFPQTICKCQHHFRETCLLQEEEVVHQMMKAPFLPLSTDSSCTLGCIHASYANWAQLTSDRFILNIIQHGVTIDFINTVPSCSDPRPLSRFNCATGGSYWGDKPLIVLWCPMV